MNNFFKQDRYIVGVVAGLGCEILFAVLLWIGLTIAGEPVMPHIRWFAGAFIPMILVLRYYAKRKVQLRVTKALIVTFFVTFIGFMAYLLSTKALELQ